MPVSEDEFDRPMQMGPNQSTMSKAEQRKSNKPIMEKRRRARINHCLNELKTLILDAMKKDPARHSKLEKADILEMTVKHLQQIQRQQLATAVATDPAVIMRFKSGFDECAAEVSRYIGRLEGVDSGVKQRLTAHLHRCVSGIQQISTFPHQNMFSALNQNCDKNTFIFPNVPSIPEDVNNNSNQNAERIQIHSGLHLIPSRLPTGELALLVPNSNHMSTFLNASPGATFQFPHNTSITMSSMQSPTLGGTLGSNTKHTSAFTAVSKNQEYPSPTSTADIVKKESNSPNADDYNTTPFSNIIGLGDQAYIQDYKSKNYKVTDLKESEEKNDDQTFKKINTMQNGQDLIESTQKFGTFKTFGLKSEGHVYDQKVTQRPTSSSFQRTVADSTTSFTQPKDSEVPESGPFKAFQVEIPNSHLKAHISVTESVENVKTSLPIHQKPNPNFTLNPNKLHQKSPHKFVRSNFNADNTFPEIGYEKFLKIEPLSIITNSEATHEVNNSNLLPTIESSTQLMKPALSETFQSVDVMTSRFAESSSQKGLKRPLTKESPETMPPSSSEPPSKTPRISLNVTLTDDQSKEDVNFGNHCKRISVIVEDSSKSNGSRENKSEVTVSVSSQKDMWRPW